MKGSFEKDNLEGSGVKNSLKTHNLNLLIYLQILVQEKHVSRAAKKAGLSQPGMSHALKELRD